MTDLAQWVLVVERLKAVGYWPSMTPEDLARLGSPALLREFEGIADALEVEEEDDDWADDDDNLDDEDDY